MADVTIYVSKRGSSRNLKLRDSEGHHPGNDDITTTVNPGNTVCWELDPRGSNLYSLEGIDKKSGSNDLLTGAPQRQNDGSYTATISSDTSLKGKTERYFIKYKITSDGPTLQDDPKLKMNV